MRGHPLLILQPTKMKADELTAVQTIVSDPARVAAVRATALLDTPAELSFDRLTRLAAKLTRAPVTFVSLVDDQRDFYKSCFGFPEPLATERELTGTTFCHYALSSDGALVINDTLADPEYSRVPTVASLGVRAYLGIPLTLASGQTIGSFCAIDFAPRTWSELDIEVMRELATSTLREIELRTALNEITEDRLRLQALAETNEVLYRKAQEANDEKDRFFAAVTHELRTPMTSIIGWTRILAENVFDSPDATEALTMIETSAHTQARLVDDLLDASRIATGKVTLHRNPIDLTRVIEEAIRAASPAASAKEVRLRSSLQPVPPLLADAIRTRQIFDNLIANAVKFTPAGGEIDVSNELTGTAIRVVVRDTGRGIAPEMLPHIFERGRQASSGEQGGLGLGLTIAIALARAHGGTIAAESDGEGRGASFIVTLPLEPADG
jgi:signal transduction histidine kinase